MDNDPNVRETETTGLLTESLPERLRCIVFGKNVDAALEADIGPLIQVNRAHVVMLAERGLISRDHARAILIALQTGEDSGFAALRGRPAPRGLYLLFETWLSETIGPEIAGRLHTGRSRNDLSATMMRLKLRTPLIAFILSLLRLKSAMLRIARRRAKLVLPIHTHYQPAQPITLGQYGAAVALAMERDVDAMMSVFKSLGRCPLGAGAIAGTTIPIDAERLAELLGFETGPENSIDAIASRDIVLRLLAALAIYGVLTSRFAHDVLFWTTQEVGYFSLPDFLVGSSSMMPQKRNVYLLEHVKGKSAAAAGALTYALTAMHAAPFTNSIAVNAEAVRPIFSALETAKDCTTLMRSVIEHLSPNSQRITQALEVGQVTATALAEHLVMNDNVPFRRAHDDIGAAIRTGRLDTVAPGGWPDAEIAVHRTAFGGGPAPSNTLKVERMSRVRLAQTIADIRQKRRTWRLADKNLKLAASEIVKKK